MDAFEEGLRRLEGELDNLRQLIPRNGDDRQLIPPPSPPPNPYLNIAGIEATQAIQYFTLVGGRAAVRNNSVAMVGNKPTLLRVYPDIDVGAPGTRVYPPPPPTISGDLTYYDRNGVRHTVRPINPTIDSKLRAQVNRSNFNDSLNFLLPAEQGAGNLLLYVRLFDPDHDPAAGGDSRYFGYSRTLQLDFVAGVDWNHSYNGLPVYGVQIAYTGPDDSGARMNLGPPLLDDLFHTVEDSLVTDMFPTSGTFFVGSQFISANQDLRTHEGWLELHSMLQGMRDTDPDARKDNRIYVALLPSEMAYPASGVSVHAWYAGARGVAIGIAGMNWAIPTAIAWAYGFSNTPCVSIDEFGCNLADRVLLDPASTFDVTGGDCGPLWVSPSTYTRLFRSILFPGPPQPFVQLAAEREYLHLNFRMLRDGAVELLPSFHLSDVRPLPELAVAEDRPRSPVAFELRDGEDQVIGFHRCHLLTLPTAEVDPDSPYHDFHEVVPWERETRSIAFFRDGGEVHKVDVEEQAPEITAASVTELDDRTNRIRLEWEAQHDTESLTYLVRYRNDEDAGWLLLAQGLAEPKFDVDLDSLPGGESCIFQIGASSTIRTTVAETDPFSVALKPRRPYIVYPEPDSTFAQGESVVLRGVGYSPDFETAPPDEVVWTSNVAGFLGYGYEVLPETLAAGLHKITLSVTDGRGGEASADVLIKKKPRE
jgi:hypothetical protein